jgi:hypothetical protein
MRTITVKVDKLAEIIAANRETHRANFEKAMANFRLQAIAVLDEQIQAVRKGGLPDRVLRLPIPEDHTSDYDRALGMLEWHEGDEIELFEGEFTQFVQDDWGWRQSFMSNTMYYVEGA